MRTYFTAIVAMPCFIGKHVKGVIMMQVFALKMCLDLREIRFN